MREPLSAGGYEQSKKKLRMLEDRLAAIENRTDVRPDHLASIKRSYRSFMRELIEDIKLYEARQRRKEPTAAN